MAEINFNIGGFLIPCQIILLVLHYSKLLILPLWLVFLPSIILSALLLTFICFWLIFIIIAILGGS